MFYSKTNPRTGKPTNVSRKTKNTYSIKVDELGHKTVVRVGETNFYNKIQEHAEECKIENIIKRVTLGDMTALNKKTAEYFDATQMPTNLAEAQQAIIRMENMFAELPIEIRREYNFSPEQFIADFGSTKFNELMGLTPVKIPAEPVKIPAEPVITEPKPEEK